MSKQGAEPQIWETDQYQEYFPTLSGKQPGVAKRYEGIHAALDKEIKRYRKLKEEFGRYATEKDLETMRVKTFFANRLISALKICKEEPSDDSKSLLENMLDYYRGIFEENPEVFGSYQQFLAGFRAEFTAGEAFLESGHRIYASTDKEDNDAKIDWWVVPKYEQHAEGRVWGIQVKHMRGLDQPRLVIPAWETVDDDAITVSPKYADADRLGKAKWQIGKMLRHCDQYENILPVYFLIPEGYYDPKTGMPDERLTAFIDQEVKRLCGQETEQEIEMVENEQEAS